MSFEIKTIEVFDRQAKRLAKHYVSFKQDYKDFLDELRKNPLICYYCADVNVNVFECL